MMSHGLSFPYRVFSTHPLEKFFSQSERFILSRDFFFLTNQNALFLNGPIRNRIPEWFKWAHTTTNFTQIFDPWFQTLWEFWSLIPQNFVDPEHLILVPMKNTADPDPGGCDPRSWGCDPGSHPFLTLDPWSHIPRYNPEKSFLRNASFTYIKLAWNRAMSPSKVSLCLKWLKHTKSDMSGKNGQISLPWLILLPKIHFRVQML